MKTTVYVKVLRQFVDVIEIEADTEVKARDIAFNRDDVVWVYGSSYNKEKILPPNEVKA